MLGVVVAVLQGWVASHMPIRFWIQSSSQLVAYQGSGAQSSLLLSCRGRRDWIIPFSRILCKINVMNLDRTWTQFASSTFPTDNCYGCIHPLVYCNSEEYEWHKLAFSVGIVDSSN